MSVLLVNVDTFFTRVMSRITGAKYDMIGSVKGDTLSLIDIYSQLDVSKLISRDTLLDCTIVKLVTMFPSSDKINIDTSTDKLEYCMRHLTLFNKELLSPNLPSSYSVLEIVSNNADTTLLQSYFDERLIEMFRLSSIHINRNLFDKMFCQNIPHVHIRGPETEKGKLITLVSKNVRITTLLDTEDLSLIPDAELTDIVTYINALPSGEERSSLLQFSRTSLKELAKRQRFYK